MQTGTQCCNKVVDVESTFKRRCFNVVVPAVMFLGPTVYVDLSTFVQSDQDLLISHAQMLAYKMHVRICSAPPVHGTVRKDYFQIWTPYASTIGVLKLNTFFVDFFFSKNADCSANSTELNRGSNRSY